jgi:AraC-like DNA-binding protein
MDPPWSLSIEDESPLTVLSLVRGSAWVVPADGRPRHLDAGAVALLRGPDHYVVADHPDSPVQIVVHPGQACTSLTGEPMAEQLSLGVRTWGNAAAGRDPRLVELFADEAQRDDHGQEVVLDRLLDVLLLTSLRDWLNHHDDEAPAWYRAAVDPEVGRALRLLHERPEAPWTVASLAHEVGLSRAAFARRFTALVGTSPMTYLTEWRLALAADLLLEPGRTIDAVARQVGYGSGFALSSAFTRVRGLSPRQHRATAS